MKVVFLTGNVLVEVGRMSTAHGLGIRDRNGAGSQSTGVIRCPA